MLKFKHNVAKELSVNINIRTDYLFGSGWTCYQKEHFCSVLYPKLTEAGYEIVYGKHDFVSDSLKKKGTQLNLYMHPSQISGYASLEDIETIVSILKECPEVVYHVEENHKEVYDLSDMEYEMILIDNAVSIKQYICDYKKTYGKIYNVGFDFAESYRIPRLNDGACFCSSDVDIHFVEVMARTLDKLNML